MDLLDIFKKNYEMNMYFLRRILYMQNIRKILCHSDTMLCSKSTETLKRAGS